MASVAALTEDLLFGSSVVSLLAAAGHQTVLIGDVSQLEPGTAEVLVVDLTANARERVARIDATNIGGMRRIAVYAHVEADVRRLAEEAGFDLVVPRSRFSREGGALVSRVAG